MSGRNNIVQQLEKLLIEHQDDQGPSFYQAVKKYLENYPEKTVKATRFKVLSKVEKMAHIGHYEIELTTGASIWSDEIYQIFAIDPRKEPSPTIEQYRKLVHPEDRDTVFTLFERSINEKTEFNLTYRILVNQKQVKYVHSIGNYEDEENKFFGTIQDVSDHIYSLIALEESEKKYRFLADHSYDIIALFRNYKLSYISPSVKHVLGYSQVQFLKMDDFSTVHPDDRQDLISIINKRMNKKEEGNITYLFRQKHKTGVYLWMEAVVNSFKDHVTGNMNSVMILRDVTEKKNMEVELKESEKRFKTLFYENTSVMLIINPENGQIEDANQSAANFYGYPVDKLKNMNISDINILASEEIKKELQISGKGRKHYFQYKHKLANNEIRDVEVFSVRLTLNDHDSIHAIVHDITDRMLAYEEIKRLNHIMEFAMVTNKMGWWEMELPSGKVRCDENKVKLLGFNKKSFTHFKDFMDLVHPDDYELTMNAMRLHLEGKKEIYECEYRIRNKENTYVWYRDTGKVLERNNGHIRVVGIAKDITSQVKVNQVLKQSEERLRITNNNISDVIWQMDANGNFTYVSPSSGKLLGYSPDELIGKNVMGFIENADLKEASKHMSKRSSNMLGNKQMTYEFRMVHKNGGTVFTEVTSNPITGENGQITGYSGITRDIGERKKIEQELTESEEKYRSLYNNAPLAYQSLDEKGYILDINPQWERILGYHKQDVIGKWFGDFLHPDFVEVFREKFPIFKKQGVIHDVQFRMKKKDGRYIEVSFEGCIGKTEDGKFKQTYCTFKDVTLENAMKKQLVESEARFRKLIENMDEGVVLLNANGIIEEHNRAAEDILELKPKDIDEITPYMFKYKTIKEDGNDFPPDEHPAMITIKEKNPQRNVIMGIVKKAGHITWIKINAEPVYFSGAPSPHALVTFTDITALAEKEKKLVEINATKDRLFSILAHDMRNPFNALLGFTELLLTNYSRYDSEKHVKYIELINRSAKSAYLLLENLLLWSRSQRETIMFQPKLIPLKPIIDQIIREHEAVLAAKFIEITIKIVPNSIEIVADAEMLKALFRNLVSNAAKFTRENGHIHIFCSKKSGTIRCCVKDTGVGISKANQKKLFRMDAHLSSEGTKSEKGTGLGLLLCKDFVERHEGIIWVESKPGKGSNFCFEIPVKQPT